MRSASGTSGLAFSDPRDPVLRGGRRAGYRYLSWSLVGRDAPAAMKHPAATKQDGKTNVVVRDAGQITLLKSWLPRGWGSFRGGDCGAMKGRFFAIHRRAPKSRDRRGPVAGSERPSRSESPMSGPLLERAPVARRAP